MRPRWADEPYLEPGSSLADPADPDGSGGLRRAYDLAHDPCPEQPEHVRLAPSTCPCRCVAGAAACRNGGVVS